VHSALQPSERPQRSWWVSSRVGKTSLERWCPKPRLARQGQRSSRQRPPSPRLKSLPPKGGHQPAGGRKRQPTPRLVHQGQRSSRQRPPSPRLKSLPPKGGHQPAGGRRRQPNKLGSKEQPWGEAEAQ